MIAGHRSSEIAQPDRKAVIADAILPWENPLAFEGDNPHNFWHSDEQEVVTATSTARRLKVTMGFADGHVAQVRRKAGSHWAAVDSDLNADQADIDALTQVPTALVTHVLPEEAEEVYY
jgi:prepilin-type processing-associated H-X9-DG protein